ncbi:MAG: hypothetical protein Q6356_000315 [Candidatus Wukongarchaeota archaeon]|nr:hypothetical protein [Candidatus Wukongarchaeota archaeon]
MNRRFVLWMPLVTTLCCISLCFAVMDMRRVSNVGRIKTIGVGVYEESQCLNPLSSIDWGVLEPSEIKSVSCYLRNEANVKIVLELTTENWIPLNTPNFIFLDWNYTGGILEVNEVRKVIFRLDVSGDITGIDNFWKKYF